MKNFNNIAGVFIEPRLVEQVYFTMINFFDVLPDNKLYFFCGKGDKNFHLQNIKKYNLDKYNIYIYELDTNNLNFKTYSNLFKSFFILDKVNEDYILTIQTDGCLCKNSKFKIDDFLKYDYIGGYSHHRIWWRETNNICNKNEYKCFNGGFSLRNKESMIKVLNTFKPEDTVKYYNGCNLEKYAEDLYYVVGMMKLNLNVGIDEFAINFCSHTKYVKNTFAVHKLYNYVNKNELNTFLKYCPEFKKFIKLKYIK